MTKKTSIVVYIILLIVVVLVGGYVWYRSSQSKQVTVQPVQQAATGSPSSTGGGGGGQVSATTTATTTTNTPAAKPVPGSCLVLQQQYCNMAKFVTSANGSISAAFELPAGVPIFSPYAGAINTGSFGPSYSGKEHILTVAEGAKVGDINGQHNANSFVVFYTGAYEINPISAGYADKGEIIATTGTTNLDKEEAFSAYNLVMGFTKNGLGTTDNTKTNEVFNISQQ